MLSLMGRRGIVSQRRSIRQRSRITHLKKKQLNLPIRCEFIDREETSSALHIVDCKSNINKKIRQEKKTTFFNEFEHGRWKMSTTTTTMRQTTGQEKQQRYDGNSSSNTISNVELYRWPIGTELKEKRTVRFDRSNSNGRTDLVQCRERFDCLLRFACDLETTKQKVKIDLLLGRSPTHRHHESDRWLNRDTSLLVSNIPCRNERSALSVIRLVHSQIIIRVASTNDFSLSTEKPRIDDMRNFLQRFLKAGQCCMRTLADGFNGKMDQQW